MSKDLDRYNKVYGKAMRHLENFLIEDLFSDLGPPDELGVRIEAVTGAAHGLRIIAVHFYTSYGDARYGDARLRISYYRDGSMLAQALVLSCEEFLLQDVDLDASHHEAIKRRMHESMSPGVRRQRKEDEKLVWNSFPELT